MNARGQLPTNQLEAAIAAAQCQLTAETMKLCELLETLKRAAQDPASTFAGAVIDLKHEIRGTSERVNTLSAAIAALR